MIYKYIQKQILISLLGRNCSSIKYFGKEVKFYFLSKNILEYVQNIQNVWDLDFPYHKEQFSPNPNLDYLFCSEMKEKSILWSKKGPHANQKVFDDLSRQTSFKVLSSFGRITQFSQGRYFANACITNFMKAQNEVKRKKNAGISMTYFERLVVGWMLSDEMGN